MRLTSHRNSGIIATNKYQKNQEIYFKLSREYKLNSSKIDNDIVTWLCTRSFVVNHSIFDTIAFLSIKLIWYSSGTRSATQSSTILNQIGDTHRLEMGRAKMSKLLLSLLIHPIRCVSDPLLGCNVMSLTVHTELSC